MDQDPKPENYLETYTKNLTLQAQNNQLDPVIGRNEEIRRVMQILSRRTKNNPVLIGDPGVGKTAIVEGLAQRIISGDVPSSLAGKQILALDLAGLLAGAKYRGEFEERLKGVLKSVEQGQGRYLLFLDELHTLVGAGAGEGAVSAANILKPALARGDLHAIGATTIKEYRLYIEADAALERRFQPVLIGEPSPENTLSILRGLKQKYELHHGVRITDSALISAVDLSQRYLPDRFLPDKAIDLIDEATSSLRMDIDSRPAELDTAQRKATQIEIELAALKKETTPDVESRKSLLMAQLADLKNRIKDMENRWQDQTRLIKSINSTREKLDKLNLDLDKAEREFSLDKAAEIKYGTIPKLQQELVQSQQAFSQVPQEMRLVREEVTDEDIARVVSRWTSIPVSRLASSEKSKLAHLEEEISRRLIGQPNAVKQVANAIRRSRAGIGDPHRPVATFLFLGPTGVGKTELAKTLAEVLFSDERSLIRLDLSEYQERHAIARLIGAPPGYVGYDEGGQLTEAVRRKPYSVILLDELEKAHPDVFNLLLQVMDDGRLTDGKGRVVNFKNTIIIMTSNLDPKLLKDTFKPEFLNRIDQTIIFEPLTPQQIEKIVDLQLSLVSARLSAQDIVLQISQPVKKFLAKIGYDPHYGARPLKRVIQDHLLDELSLQIIEGKIKPKDTVKVSLDNQKIVLN